MVFHVLIARLISLLTGVVSLFFLLRVMPEELYGEFLFSVSLLLLAGQLANMGMQSVVLKRFVKDHSNHSYWFMGYVANHISLNVIFCAIASFYLYKVNVSLPAWIASLAMLGWVIRPSVLFEPLLQGRGHFKALSEFSVAYSLISMLSKFAFVYIGVGYIYLSILIELVVFLLYVYWRGPSDISSFLSVRYFRLNKRLLFLSVPFAISAIFYLLNSRVDQLMVRHMTTSKELADYMLFIKLAEITAIFSMSICTVLTTYALKECAAAGVVKKTTQSYYGYNLLIVVCGLVGAFSIPESWFALLLGDSYGAVFELRYLLVAMYVMYSITQYLGVLVLVRELQRLAVWRAALCFIFNLPLYYCGLYLAGIEGLVVVIVLSNILVSLVLYSVAPSSRIIIADLMLRSR